MSRSLVIKNAVAQYGFVAARYVIPLLSLPFLARVLGPDSYGVRAYILSFMLLVQAFADFGFNMSGTKEVVETKSEQGKRNRLVTAITLSKLCFLLALLVVSMVAASVLDITRDHLACVLIAYIGIFFNCLIPDFVFMGFEKMSVVTTRFVVSKGISLALIILLVKNADDLMLSIALDSLAGLVAFLLAWRKAAKNFGYAPSRVSVRDMTVQIKNATPYFLATISVSLFNSLATLLVGIVGTTYEVACWSLSITALNAVLSLYNPIQNAVYPHMVHSRDFGLMKVALVAGTVCSLAAAIIFALLAASIISILVGDEYTDGAYMIMILAPVVSMAYPTLMLGAPILGALGYEKDLAKASIIAATLYALLCAGVFVFGIASIASLGFCRVSAESLLLVSRMAYVWLRLRN